MARDYLAIPGSSVASERVFSSMRHIGTDFRNRIKPRLFESLQILKAGYKAGLISAAKEAADSDSCPVFTVDDLRKLFAESSGEVFELESDNE